MNFNFPLKKNATFLALGAESSGNFTVYKNGKIFLSHDFGDLLEEKKWKNYQKAVLKYLKDNKIKPEIILNDFHPLFKTTIWGEKLAKKYKAKLIPVQHHIAHIFSSYGDYIINSVCPVIAKRFYGVAMDGTGYGTDEKIWGGEIFEISNSKTKRIGHLENQFLIGGDLAIHEPARMLISILNKFLNKQKIYLIVRKYYNRNEFELLHNQLQQNFNCLETSSTGRILDAVSLFLGFCKNKRGYKHEPIDKLKKNSTKPFNDLKLKIIKNKNGEYILETTPLFRYLLSKINLADKKRLAATAQFYIAKGLYEIIRKQNKKEEIFIAGGLANNKIISSFFESQGAYEGKLIPRGDAGLSFGQIIYYLMKQKSGDNVVTLSSPPHETSSPYFTGASVVMQRSSIL